MCWFILAILGYAMCKGLQETIKTRKVNRCRLKRRLQHAKDHYKRLGV